MAKTELTVTVTMNDVRAFERELIISFRGELRRINPLLPSDQQNSGTACRIAAFLLGEKLRPDSEAGRLWLKLCQGQSNRSVLYPSQPLGATDVRQRKIERVSLHRIAGEPPRKGTRKGGQHGADVVRGHSE